LWERRPKARYQGETDMTQSKGKRRKTETKIVKRMTGWEASDYKAFYSRAGYVYLRVNMDYSTDVVMVTGRR
jgi:hypothetical protein